MDPNALLTEILSLASAIQDDLSILTDDVDELAAKVKALDEWLTAGGFLPARWSVRG